MWKHEFDLVAGIRSAESFNSSTLLPVLPLQFDLWARQKSPHSIVLRVLLQSAQRFADWASLKNTAFPFWKLSKLNQSPIPTPNSWVLSVGDHYKTHFIYQYINTFLWPTWYTPLDQPCSIFLLFNFSYYNCHVPFITLFCTIHTWTILVSIKPTNPLIFWYWTSAVFPSNAFFYLNSHKFLKDDHLKSTLSFKNALPLWSAALRPQPVFLAIQSSTFFPIGNQIRFFQVTNFLEGIITRV